MSRRFYLVTFVLAAIVQLSSGLMGWSMIHHISKCLLLPALAAYYLTSAQTRSNVFLAGLFFCWLGDVLLIFPGFFIGGLASFFMAHVMYIIAYRQHQSEDTTQELLVPQKIRFSLPVILSGTGLVVVLFPVLGGLQIPVLLYAIVIIVMVMTSIFRSGRTSPASFWLVFGGAALFMISDSILAINKFLTPVMHGEFWIMLTYMTAQLMIVVGIVRHSTNSIN